jgi:hypothetical protein
MKTLKQPRRTEKTLLRISREKIRQSPNGISAVFVKVTKNWGIKLFQNEEQRDEVYNRQKTFHGVGYAPALGDKIELPETVIKNWKEFKYGYFTEVITPIVDKSLHICDQHQQADKFEEEWGSYWEDDSRISEYIREISELAGEELYDMHPSNLGYDRNGTLMPLDFGND